MEIAHATVSPMFSRSHLRRTGLSRADEGRLRERLRHHCPSSPWIDAQFETVTRLDDGGRILVLRYHDPSVFPPGGAETAMVRCPACGIFTPPNAFENGICLDHWEPEETLEPNRNWGRSPSALAIAALQSHDLRLDELRLAPESTPALLREIRRAKTKVRKAQTRRERNERRRKSG